MDVSQFPVGPAFFPVQWIRLRLLSRLRVLRVKKVPGLAMSFIPFNLPKSLLGEVFEVKKHSAIQFIRRALRADGLKYKRPAANGWAFCVISLFLL